MYLVTSMCSHQMHVLRLHKGMLHLSNIPVVYRHHGPRSDSPITGTLTAQAVNGPVFVPKATVAILAVLTPPPMLASHELVSEVILRIFWADFCMFRSAPQSPTPQTEEHHQDYGTFRVSQGHSCHPHLCICSCCAGIWGELGEGWWRRYAYWPVWPNFIDNVCKSMGQEIYVLVSTCATLYNTVYVCLCIKMGLLYYDTMGSYVVSRKGYICNYSAI